MVSLTRFRETRGTASGASQPTPAGTLGTTQSERVVLQGRSTGIRSLLVGELDRAEHQGVIVELAVLPGGRQVAGDGFLGGFQGCRGEGRLRTPEIELRRQFDALNPLRGKNFLRRRLLARG